MNGIDVARLKDNLRDRMADIQDVVSFLEESILYDGRMVEGETPTFVRSEMRGHINTMKRLVWELDNDRQTMDELLQDLEAE